MISAKNLSYDEKKSATIYFKVSSISSRHNPHQTSNHKIVIYTVYKNPKSNDFVKRIYVKNICTDYIK